MTTKLTTRVYFFYFLSFVGIAFVALEWLVIVRSDKVPGIDFLIYFDSAKNFLASPHSLYQLENSGFAQYLYPPPSILVFIPLTVLPAKVAFFLFVILMYLCLLLSLYLWRKVLVRNDIFLSTSGFIGITAILTASCAMYHNATLGQINCLVLLLSMLFIFFLSDKPILAGCFLALAIWIKVYPLVLLLPALFSKEGRKSIVSCFMLGILIPLILWPWIPLEQYGTFVNKLNVMSDFSSGHIINQSVIGFLLRLSLSYGEMISWPNIFSIPLFCKIINLLLFGVLVGMAIYRVAKVAKKSGKTYVAQFGLTLASIAIFAPLGWGHVYIFTLPLLMLGFFLFLEKNNDLLLFSSVGLVALLLVIPIYNTPGFMRSSPLILAHLYYARLTIVNLGVFVMVLLLLKPQGLADLTPKKEL
ncbi:MAG: DUF2029 domain-containing protein [Cyclobacteriaceae bacterium]|nr:DUF2029 domain-containing protein [Cyclobacteriaceae bacterium]